MTDPDHRRAAVAVIGGGIHGSALTASLARAGASVTQITRTDGELPASRRTLGWVNSAAPTSDHYDGLRRLGQQRLLLEAQRSASRWYYAVDTLEWDDHGRRQPLPTQTAVEAIGDAFTRRYRLGHDVRLISASEAARVEPALDPSRFGAEVLYARDEGWVDVDGLLSHLDLVAQEHGAARVPGTVTEIVANDPGSGFTIRLSDARIVTADNVVVAAGAATTELLATAGVTLPHASTTAVKVITAPIAHPPRAILWGPDFTARGDLDDRVTVLSKRLEAEATASADGVSIGADSVAEVLAEVSGVLAAKPDLVAERVLVGSRPIPGDALPVVGAVDDVPGLHVLFSHSGITVGLLLAELLAGELTDPGVPSPLLTPYRAFRF